MFQINFECPCHIYFIGIGGISMSGLAEILLSRGFSVSGSDLTESPLTKRLSQKGAVIYYGQSISHITEDVDVVVYTAAIHPDNAEFLAMQERQLPHLTRAQLLGQLMKNYEYPIAVAGTHGKTTTTSMIAETLMASDTDPTLSIGGILPSIGGNIRVGSSPYFLTEACEYTNSFLSFFPRIGIILNVEEDHMDFFRDLEDIRSSFRSFAKLLPEDGTLILNDEIADGEALTKDLACSVITYGFSPGCDYRASQISYDKDGRPAFLVTCKGTPDRRLSLGVAGRHNISNALAAIALADLLGLPEDSLRKALSSFTGTKRRFEYKGRLGDITVMDDYAHHPTEITVTLEAAKQLPHSRIVCIFQPHTYSRTKAFLSQFARALAAADVVVLADIYASRETDSLGISSLDLLRELKLLGKECVHFPTFDEIENYLLENSINGDLLITMGAGDIVKVGESLLGI